MTSSSVTTWQQAQALSESHGDTFYTTETDRITMLVERLRSAFCSRYPRSAIAYAYKSNYVPAVCRFMHQTGLMAEAGSDLEWWLARRLGVPGTDIVSNGVNRSPESLREAIVSGAVVNLHTPRDLQIAVQAAREAQGREYRVGLRCSIQLADTRTSRFGFADDALTSAARTISATSGLRLAGLHAHAPGGPPATIADRATALVAIAEALFADQPEYLDVGGGFHGGLAPQPDAPTVEEYAHAVTQPLIRAYGSGSEAPQLILEPGTSLIASAVSYLTKVLAVSRVDDRVVATVAGSLFHTSPNTRRTTFPVTVLRETLRPDQDDSFDVAGSTLIEGEYLAFGIPGPVSVGDFLRFDNVGAYSVGGMTPPFLVPVPPMLARGSDDQWHLWRPAQTPSEVFAAMLPTPD